MPPSKLGNVFKAALIIILAFMKRQIGFWGGDGLPDAAQPNRCREPVCEGSEGQDPEGIPHSKRAYITPSVSAACPVKIPPGSSS